MHPEKGQLWGPFTRLQQWPHLCRFSLDVISVLLQDTTAPNAKDINLAMEKAVKENKPIWCTLIQVRSIMSEWGAILGVSESLKMTIISSAVVDPVGCAIIQISFIWVWKRGPTGEDDDGALPPKAICRTGNLFHEKACSWDLWGNFLRCALAP